MGSIYRQKNARKTPLYRLFTQAYNEFKAVTDEKYKPKYGFFRPEIDKEADKLLLRQLLFRLGKNY